MRLKVFNSFFALCVATVAVSCSNDQVIDDLRPAGDTDSDMISFMVADDTTRGGSFGNRPGSSTRATLTTSSSIKNPNIPFAVYGDMTSIDDSSNTIALFNQEEVNYIESDDSWKYDNLRYWFPGYEYSFVAIHPATIIPKDQTSNDGLISEFDYSGSQLSFTYTLPSDYTKTTDIMVAGYRRMYESSSPVGLVYLFFGHIMTRLNFVAKIESVSQNSSIDIKNITIKGVTSNASYSVLPANILPNSTESFDLTADWNIPSTPTRISLTKTISADNVEKTTQNKTTSFSLFPADKDPLLVIPQETDDIVIQITYSQQGKGDVTIEGRLNSTSIVKWGAGKSYTYSLTISDNDYIVFGEPVLDDWEEGDGSSYIIMN